MKYGKVVFLLFTLIFLATGCGFKDIDKRFFVVAMGIDKADDPSHKYKVLVKLSIPSAEEKFGANKFLLVYEEGDNITDAVRLIKSKIDKELDFGHVKVLLLGEEIAKQDVREATDWFSRRRDIQRIAWMAIAKPTAQSILDLKPQAERLPANSLILSFGQSGTESAYISSEYLFDFYARMKERGLDPFLPIIEPPKGDGMFTTNTVAILDKHSTKLVLTPDETKALNAVAFGLAKIDVKVGEGKDTFMVSAENIKSKYSIDTKENKPVINMNIKIEGTIEESKSNLSLSKLTKYEEMTNRFARERALNLLKKLQKANVDPVGFGLRYRAKSFNKWSEWETLYPTIDFQVNVDTKLRGTGIIQ